MSEENDQDMDRLASDSDHLDQDTSARATLVDETPLNEQVIPEAPIFQTFTPNVPSSGIEVNASATLFNNEEAEQFRTRWNEIQGGFVDEPRQAVEHADTLVNEVIEKITQMFAAEHNKLEDKWKQTNEVSTEDLRLALQQYRAFLDRLLV